MLTDTAIKSAKPKPKLYRLADAGGLCLEITPNGSKLWRYRYRFDGKAKMLSIGPYPAVSLSVARTRRDEARQQLVDGIDPSVQKQANRQAEAAKHHTFRALADEWFAYSAPRWAPATANKARQYLDKDILPIIGERPVTEITRPELVLLVREVEKLSAFNVATKMRQWLGQIFRFGLAKGVVESNPSTDLSAVAEHGPRVQHYPHVTFAELPELLKAVDASNSHILTRYAIHLLVLTGVRPGEQRHALWSDIDLDAALWTIPAERMKARRPHLTPLPRQAVALLRQAREITGAYPLVFAGSARPERPMSENTVNKALKLAGYEGRQVGHGFRHLLSTELNSRGYNRDWVEKQLAHGDPDIIRDTYNHATYLEQRREMMQAWADSIDALRAGVTVVAIKRKA